MRKLMLALVAGCMSAAVAGAYAAAGSPADTDKAGRAGPGTAAGEMGAAKPTPTTPGAGGGMSKGGSMSKGEASPAGAGASAGGASATAGSSATATGGDDMGKAKGKRRAARASKG